MAPEAWLTSWRRHERLELAALVAAVDLDAAGGARARMTRARALPALWAHEAAGSITRLHLSNYELTPQAVEVFVGASALRLTELELFHCALSLEGFRALVGAPWALDLRALSCEHVWLGPPLCDALAEVELPRLRALTLRHARLDVQALLAMARWQTLRPARVELGSNPGLLQQRDGPTILLNLGEHLRELGLANTGLSQQRLRDWAWPAQARGLAALERLELGAEPLQGVLPSLAVCEAMTSLRALQLRRASLGDEGVWPLWRASWLSQLEALSVADNGLSLASAKALASLDAPALRRLDLSWNPLGGAGARWLLRAPWIGQLDELSLRGVGLDEEALLTLLESERAASLVALDARHNDALDHLDAQALVELARERGVSLRL